MGKTVRDYPQIANFIEQLEVYAADTYKNMTVFYFKRPNGKSHIEYLLLDEALQTDTVEVSETSEAGTVPYLEITNKADKELLLVDGEVLVGAKQNRVVNTSILIPRKTRQRIPVSCVEQGRWHYQGRKFSSSTISHINLRKKKSTHVSHSLRHCGAFHSNQSEIWNEVTTKTTSMETFTHTSSLYDVYKNYQEELNNFKKAFEQNGHAIGIAVSINDVVQCADMFDKPATLRKLKPRLIEGYALDALEALPSYRQQNTLQSESQVHDFICQVLQVKVAEYQAVGLGHELRFESDNIIGSCLVHADQVIHMGIFNNREELRHS